MNAYNGFSGALRSKAQRWLRAEWAAGRRPQPKTCEACGQDQGIIHAHAEDYSEPFGDHTDRYKLCYRCHMMLHCRFKNPRQWEKYKELVRDGMQFPPIARPSFGLIRRHLNGNFSGATWAQPPRESTVLDQIVTTPEAVAAARKTEDDGQQRSLWGEKGSP